MWRKRLPALKPKKKSILVLDLTKIPLKECFSDSLKTIMEKHNLKSNRVMREQIISITKQMYESYFEVQGITKKRVQNYKELMRFLKNLSTEDIKRWAFNRILLGEGHSISSKPF